MVVPWWHSSTNGCRRVVRVAEQVAAYGRIGECATAADGNFFAISCRYERAARSAMSERSIVLDGGRIRRLREQRGLSSQGDLALATVTIDPKRGGLAARTIWDAENQKPVSRRTQLLIARALGIDDPDELLLPVEIASGDGFGLFSPVGKTPASPQPDREWNRPRRVRRAAAVLFVCLAAASWVFWRQIEPGSTPVRNKSGSQVGLDTAVWTVNGSAARAALANMDTPRARIVEPILSFSPKLGLGISGVDGTYEQTGIQTAKPFVPPFVVRATVMATAINAGAFVLAVTSADGGQGAALAGGQGANDVFTGLTLRTATGLGMYWKLDGKLSEPRAPSPNTWYDLAIAVDVSGAVTVSAGPQGTDLRRKTEPAVGPGPFYVVLAQGSGAHGPGPNQAYWRAVTISGHGSVTALRFRHERARLADIGRF